MTTQSENNISVEEKWMQRALKLARKAEVAGEVPVGAVLVKHDALIAEGFNRPIQCSDATAHAEIVALREAGKRFDNYRLPDTTLYVTLEPCPMCVGALIHARVARVVYAATDPKTGALGGAFNLLDSGVHNHRFEVKSGVLADESKQLLQNFFRARRR